MEFDQAIILPFVVLQHKGEFYIIQVKQFWGGGGSYFFFMLQLIKNSCQ